MEQVQEGLYTVSKHAKERYAERCRGKSSVLDVQAYVAAHEDRIQDDVNQMLQHGRLVYSGKQRGPKGESILEVYIQGLWIILADQKARNVITLYRVNLGCGEDLDKTYMERMLEKLEQARSRYENTLEEVNAQNEEYRGIIETGNAQIKEYRADIRKLEEMCEGYNMVISSNQVRVRRAADAMADIANTLIGKKTF